MPRIYIYLLRRLLFPIYQSFAKDAAIGCFEPIYAYAAACANVHEEPMSDIKCRCELTRFNAIACLRLRRDAGWGAFFHRETVVEFH